MTTRLQQAFKTLRETGRKGVVPYITAGDPSLETTYQLLVAMARAEPRPSRLACRSAIRPPTAG